MAVRRACRRSAAGSHWALGIDGIALVLIMLSVFLMPICIGASWRAIEKRVPEYMAAFLLMEALMIGVFAAQDLFLFYIFFEGGLIPMYLIIGIWGGAERIKASYKFFLYTLLGSVLMLIAMLYMVIEAGTTVDPGADGPRFPGRGAEMAVARLLRQLRGQDADVAGPHLAARRPRPGADRGLGDPGRRAAQDGRLRLHPLLAADVPRRLGDVRAVGVLPERDRGRLHQPRRAGAARHEEADRLFVGRAHGVRHLRPVRDEPPGASRAR